MNEFDESAEHFVTYFDKGFLLQGLSLYESIRNFLPTGVLWVICLDRDTHNIIQKLNLPQLNPLLLDDFETPEMLSKKMTRSKVEYIYMLTPFTYFFVKKVCPLARRITYVDADIYLFLTPQLLFQELELSGKSVLMTEHGYSPEYDKLKVSSGRFCVQFLPIVMDKKGIQVILDWQNKCLESTGINHNDRQRGFGDQKYLEDWPIYFPDNIHISLLNSLMLAPWNAQYQMKINGKFHIPVFYHFHSFKFISNSWIQCCSGFKVTLAIQFYNFYISSLKRQILFLKEKNIINLSYKQTKKKLWAQKLFLRYFFGKILLRRI